MTVAIRCSTPKQGQMMFRPIAILALLVSAAIAEDIQLITVDSSQQVSISTGSEVYKNGQLVDTDSDLAYRTQPGTQTGSTHTMAEDGDEVSHAWATGEYSATDEKQSVRLSSFSQMFRETSGAVCTTDTEGYVYQRQTQTFTGDVHTMAGERGLKLTLPFRQHATGEGFVSDFKVQYGQSEVIGEFSGAHNKWFLRGHRYNGAWVYTPFFQEVVDANGNGWAQVEMALTTMQTNGREFPVNSEYDVTMHSVALVNDNARNANIEAYIETEHKGVIPFSFGLGGDINGNGSVGADDMVILAMHFGMPSIGLNVYGMYAMGDLNWDGVVDDLDAAILAGYW